MKTVPEIPTKKQVIAAIIFLVVTFALLHFVLSIFR